jgi:hypothetical protein
VVLVRPWRDAHGGGGCCGGDVRGGICFEHRVGGTERDGAAPDPVAAAYRLLHERLPGVDVQVVGADNVAFLLPAAFRDARRHTGRLAALRHALHSTTPGAVLVDGVVVGHVEALGAEGVLAAVRQAGSGTSSTAATV